MKKATIRQVRHDFGRVLEWVQEGEEVEIQKYGKIVAILSPPVRKKGSKKARPDFAERFKKLYGEKRLKGNIILEERESRPY
jgi:antitoxin (DNA-binding transcriptional repressor) of toxin-antitoxin stability system